MRATAGTIRAKWPAALPLSPAASRVVESRRRKERGPTRARLVTRNHIPTVIGPGQVVIQPLRGPGPALNRPPTQNFARTSSTAEASQHDTSAWHKSQLRHVKTPRTSSRSKLRGVHGVFARTSFALHLRSYASPCRESGFMQPTIRGQDVRHGQGRPCSASDRAQNEPALHGETSSGADSQR